MKERKTEMKGIEDDLKSGWAMDPELWERIWDDFGKRAAVEDLIDVSYEIHDSPFGPLVIGATEHGLVRVGLSVESEEDVLEGIARLVSPRIMRSTRPEITSARTQLDQYFSGERTDFELTLDWQMSRGFRRQVLIATDRIPYGQTSTYRAVATEAGSPNAVRAAGTALAHNPLPIVVPCHRVLRSDGQVGSYLGGASMKERLLEMENRRR